MPETREAKERWRILVKLGGKGNDILITGVLGAGVCPSVCHEGQGVCSGKNRGV